MTLDPAVIYKNAEDAWPGVLRKDLIWIGPLGSRDDALIINKALREVTTGRRGTGAEQVPCFKGTFEQFESKMEADYAERLSSPYAENMRLIRLRDEYRAVCLFLRSLPPTPQ